MMKRNKLVNLIILLVVFSTVLSVSSCRMEGGILEFSIKEFDDYTNTRMPSGYIDRRELIRSETANFAKVGNTVIVPQIAVRGHYDTYQIWVEAWSETEEDSITVKDVSLFYKEERVFNMNLQRKNENINDDIIVLKEDNDGIYVGSLIAGSFTEDDLHIENGMELNMVVAVEQCGAKKDIHFVISVREYEMAILPT